MTAASSRFRSTPLLLAVLMLVALAAPAVAQDGGGKSFEQTFDGLFAGINNVINAALFFSIAGPNHNIPFVVAVLVLGSIFFTFWYGWINLRGFRHSIDVIRGRFDNPNDKGEISHFQALTSALSATIGLGNIAGVALAVGYGGPGAVFWMMLIALFGMTAKFSECTLAQFFRQHNPDGTISGGPMYYLTLGLKEKGPGWGAFGRALGIMYAIMAIGGAFGGGNMFQANQSFEAFASTFGIPMGPANPWSARIYGVVMAFLVGIVIIGGIKRIGAATSKIIPFMCVLYVGASLLIILNNASQIPAAIGAIVGEAFTPKAGYGGLLGVMIWGFKRAAFSNEAGVGSAAIAHAAAKTEEPVREGIVGMIGPFIDTIVICFMTGMVVTITGSYNSPEMTQALADGKGVTLTTYAFGTLASWFPYILSICIVLFAYSTMISWCYYGERAWTYLFGRGSLLAFRLLFVLFVFLGSILKLANVLTFSDLMILCMAFPNILGSVFLAPKVRDRLADYWKRYKSGQMKTYS